MQSLRRHDENGLPPLQWYGRGVNLDALRKQPARFGTPGCRNQAIVCLYIEGELEMEFFTKDVIYNCPHARSTGGYNETCNSFDTKCDHTGIEGSFFVAKWESSGFCDYMGKENKCPANKGAKWQ